MLLEGDLGKIPESALGPIQTIFNQTTRLGRLINNMLDISKIEAGNGDEFILSMVHIATFLREIRDDFISLALEKSIELVWNVDIDDNLELKIPVDRFKQAIINLIANAIKFTPIQ